MEGVASWSSLGLVLLLATVLQFLAAPMANSISRRIEHNADVYGQEVIHGLVPDPQATAVDSFCSDAAVWLDNPSAESVCGVLDLQPSFDGATGGVRGALRSLAAGTRAALLHEKLSAASIKEMAGRRPLR